MRLVKRILLYLMGVFYVFAGIMHFVRRSFYVRIMPDYLPWHEELVTLSGLAEIALGVAVLIPRLRILAAWGLIALLVAIFPANVNVALNDLPMGDASEPSTLLNWIRLPFQAVFIAWAWWYTRPSPDAPGAT